MGVLEAKRLISQSAVLACFYHVIFSVCSAALYFISFFSFFLFNNFIIGICILSLLLIYQQKKICIRIVIHIVDRLQPIEAAELDLPAKRKDVGDRNVNCPELVH